MPLNNLKKVFLTVILLAVACTASGLEAAEQNLDHLQGLYDKTAASGSVRIIVTVSPPQLPDTTAMTPREFDILLAGRVRAAQSKVIDALPPGRVITGPVRFPFTPQFAATVTAEGLTALAGNPDVAAVQEDVPEFPLLDQSVPHIFPSHATSSYTGDGWTVAVLDTGIDKDHPFLSGKVLAEACYSTTSSISTSFCPGGVSSSTAADSGLPCPEWIDGCDHGTHVAGIAAGSGDTFDGLARNSALIAVQVFSRFDDSSFCEDVTPCVASYISDQILGLQRVYSLRETYSVASVNMSLGGGYNPTYCDGDSRKATIDLLKDAGIATVIASGNNGYADGVSAPGCISTAITVGATNDTVDTRASFSNNGSQLDFYAPGLSIYSSVPGGGYASWGGTSMASPHVAGAWAVLRQKYPLETVDEIEARFDDSGVSVTSYDISRQRIDIDEALGEAGGNGLRFVPVPPCRIVDTRVAGGKIPAGTARSFMVYGYDADIQNQGGTGDCGVSWTSGAVVLNLTSTAADSTGHFRVYPYGSSLPTASILNVPSGLTIANATVSSICQPACPSDITVYSSMDSHVVIDVMGYME